MSFGWIHPDLTKPGFSARECAKQLILLEDHLACPGKGCPDCISKHKLAAEAFAEEALQLGGREAWLQNLPTQIRGAAGPQDYRAIRKDLTAHLREVGMAGLVGLGRLRGVGLGQSPRMFSHFIIYFPVTNMDPVMWASSDPGLKLGMKYEGPTPQPGQHIFGTASDPNTVSLLLKQDQRVGWAEIVRQDPIDEGAVVPAADVPGGVPVPETRPEPGKPEMKLPGYIPRMGPGDSGGKLTEDEKLAAGLGPLVQQAKQPSGIPWWLLLLGAYMLSRR